MSGDFFLATERLGLRTWWEGDLELALSLWSDGSVTRFVGGPFTHSQVRERLASEIMTQRTRGFQYWPVFQLSDNALVGCCGLRLPGKRKRVPELGCHLRPMYWGLGYASEAALAVIRYANQQLGVRQLFAVHHPHNHASASVVKKLGFEYVRHELHPPTGLMHPLYSLRLSGEAPRS